MPFLGISQSTLPYAGDYPTVTLSTGFPTNFPTNCFDDRESVKSRYDTTVLYEGRKDSAIIYDQDTQNWMLAELEIPCEHSFVAEDRETGYMGIRGASCAVAHDLAGCWFTWLNQKEICTKCLRHIHVEEHRWVEPLPKKETYAEALKRLNRLK